MLYVAFKWRFSMNQRIQFIRVVLIEWQLIFYHLVLKDLLYFDDHVTIFYFLINAYAVLLLGKGLSP